MFSPSGIPACVLCAARNGDDDGPIEPFVLRTYEYPDVKERLSAEDNESDQFRDNPAVGNVDTADDDKGKPSFALVRSASGGSVSIIDAMAATCAVPVVFDRVHINIGGKEKAFADGGLFCNSPVAIAIDEARRLYPRRPLGVVLSIGMSTDEDRFTSRAIDIARLSNPGLHFQRIVPQEIMTDFDFLETNPEKVAAMGEEVRQFMRHDVATNQSLAVTIEKLFTSDCSGIRDEQMMPNVKPSIVTPRTDTEVYDRSGGHDCEEEEEEVSMGESRMFSFLCCYKKRGNATNEEDTHSDMIKASKNGKVTTPDINIDETWDSISLDDSSMDWDEIDLGPNGNSSVEDPNEHTPGSFLPQKICRV